MEIISKTNICMFSLSEVHWEVKEKKLQLLKLFTKYFNKDVTASTLAIFNLKGADSQSIEVN